MPTTRFCASIGVPERTWRRHEARARGARPTRGPWPRPARARVAELRRLKAEVKRAAPGERDPQGGGRDVRGRARRRTHDRRAGLGVEPTYRVLTEHGTPIAPQHTLSSPAT